MKNSASGRKTSKSKSEPRPGTERLVNHVCLNLVGLLSFFFSMYICSFELSTMLFDPGPSILLNIRDTSYTFIAFPRSLSLYSAWLNVHRKLSTVCLLTSSLAPCTYRQRALSPNCIISNHERETPQHQQLLRINLHDGGFLPLLFSFLFHPRLLVRLGRLHSLSRKQPCARSHLIKIHQRRACTRSKQQHNESQRHRRRKGDSQVRE